VPLTINLRLAAAPGTSCSRGAHRTSEGLVANVSQTVSVDRGLLSDRVGHLPESHLQLILAGIDLVLGRE
jgi:mRNA-degrading endonuclease toxin of MazEF toxin-antitoxin module